MTAIAEQIYQDAIHLDPIDRAGLIDKLYLSFSSNRDETIENNWKKEVINRRKAYDKGEISTDTIDNVFNRLNRR